MDERIYQYVQSLIQAPINLTAFKELNEALANLYHDSVIPLKKEEIGDYFIDIGTGGGVPGVFVALEYNVKGLLVDSVCKKIEYVEKLCKEIKIEGLEFLCERAENLKNIGYLEKFDSAFSRAVSKTSVVLELTVPYVKVGGKIFVYKGTGYNEELGQSINAMKELNVKLEEVRKYEIQRKDRYLLIFRKIGKTSEKYPRKVGIPEKRPL